LLSSEDASTISFERLGQLHNITSQMTWLLSNTAMWT